MSGREWKPGDVAWLKGNGIDGPAIRTQQGSWAWVDPNGGNPVQGASFAHESWGGTARPLVVIDPEDREAVERLIVAYYTRIDGMKYWNGDLPDKFADNLQAALREFANPKPPEVFRHFIAKHDGGLKTAHCGKVWRPNAEANVTVIGDCPECTALVASGWSA